MLRKLWRREASAQQSRTKALIISHVYNLWLHLFIKAEQIPTDPADLLEVMEAHGLLFFFQVCRRPGGRSVVLLCPISDITSKSIIWCDTLMFQKVGSGQEEKKQNPEPVLPSVKSRIIRSFNYSCFCCAETPGETLKSDALALLVCPKWAKQERAVDS